MILLCSLILFPLLVWWRGVALPFDWRTWFLCLRLTFGHLLVGELQSFSVQLFLFVVLSSISMLNMLCLGESCGRLLVDAPRSLMLMLSRFNQKQLSTACSSLAS